MRIPRPKRVANKIIFLVLGLEMFSLSIWGTMTYQASRKELLNSISNKLNEAAFRTRTNIGAFFEPIKIHVNHVAKTVFSMRYGRDKTENLFNQLLRERPEIAEVSYIESDGREIVRIARLQGYAREDLRNMKGHPLVKKALAGEYAIGNVEFSRYHEPRVFAAMPANSPDGGSRAVLILIRLGELETIIQKQRVGRTGYAYVVNDRGKLIGHLDRSLVLGELDAVKMGAPVRLFQGGGSDQLLRYRNFQGKSVTGVSRFDSGNRWWVVVEQLESEGLAPLTRVIQRFALAFFLAATVTIFAVLYFSRATMRPLETFREGLDRIEKGERNVRMDIPATTELSSLGGRFNAMAGSLDERIAELTNSREHFAQSEKRYRRLMETANDAIFILDVESGFIMEANRRISALVGLPREDIIGMRYRKLFPEEELPLWENILAGKEASEEGATTEMNILRGDGGMTPAEMSYSRARVEGREIIQAILRDITERKAQTAKLQYLATHDSLTGLPNRYFLMNNLEEALSNRDDGTKAALLLIDLDRFKEVNDTLGHKSGDLLLKHIGPRLTRLTNSRDVLARLGGDEFALLMKTISDPEEALAQARAYIASIQESFDLTDANVQIDASIGISLFPDHGADAGSLLRCADIAMYDAKRRALGVSLYDSSLDEHSPRKLMLLSELGDAIKKGELVLYYQPKIDLKTKMVLSAEALVRWRHPRLGLVAPDEFISIVELSNQIKPLTAWALNQAAVDCRRWLRMGADMGVSVNVSARNLQDVELPETVRATLARNELSSARVVLEITEHALMLDPVRAHKVIMKLNELGITLSIDDFGTGYSSLAYLRDLPVRVLKIDKSFVMDMTRDENDAVIVRSTIDLAHNLGMFVIAEGVETPGTQEALEKLDCDAAQGYFFSMPLPFSDMMEWMKDWNRRNNLPELGAAV